MPSSKWGNIRSKATTCGRQGCLPQLGTQCSASLAIIDTDNMSLLPSLFAPIKIKSLELVNRAVMPPMGTNLGNPDGTVSEANLAYIKRRRSGGAGLIITEIASIRPSGSAIPNELGAYDDRFIPGLKKIADAGTAAGRQGAFQLHHAAR